MNQDNYSVMTQNQQDAITFKLVNLPEELLEQPRFFELYGKNKSDTPKDWSNPDNQKLYTEIAQGKWAGFDISGHGRAADYLLVDFDHVLDDSGNFVNEDAAKWFKTLAAYATYCEISQSRHGIHMLFRLTEGRFKMISGGKRGTLHFGEAAKLELFYLTKSHYCLFTGNLFQCEPNAPIVAGERADDAMQKILDEIERRNTPKQSARKSRSLGDDYDSFRANIMLDAIDPADLDDTDWLAVISACKHIGIPYLVVDEWNKQDPDRYNEAENQSRWDSATDPSFNIETLHGIAKRFNYAEKDARRQWYDLHPELSNKPAVRADFHSSSALMGDAGTDDIIADIRENLCEWKVDKKGKKLYILPSSKNILTIFNHDPNLKNLIGYDEFNGTIALTRRPVWSHYKRFTPEWTDTDDAQLRMYLRKNYAEFSAKELITQTVISISQERIFNAVKNYFAKLPKWDGKPRAETLFIKYLRVDDTPYAREITLNWLIAAVARIFEPGCRYQTALVLQGAQGIGKSYIIELLGGKWYLELTDSVDDSHASDAIKKGWIVELKEMAAMRKAEINAVKAFIERASEKRREPYAKNATETPRHCVFAITVNDNEFLRDQTGNRRYMILKCNSEKLGYVDGLTVEEIKQVWAEVLVKYSEMFKDGFDEKKLALSRETALKAEEVATHYLQDDGMAGEVRAFLDKKILPQYIWQLLTREERRKFFAEGRLVLFDGLADLNKRRRAIGGKEDVVQHDVNLISSFLDGVAGKDYVRRNEVKRGEDTIEEFIVYGSEYRQHICAAEIFNECFGSDKRKTMYRISEILNQIDGWTLGGRLRNADKIYFDQRKPYYRDANNAPDDETEKRKKDAHDDYYNEPIDPTDTPF